MCTVYLANVVWSFAPSELCTIINGPPYNVCKLAHSLPAFTIVIGTLSVSYCTCKYFTRQVERKLDAAQETIIDQQQTIEKFRELVHNLQSDLTDLRERGERAGDSGSSGTDTQKVMNLNVQLKSAIKAQARVSVHVLLYLLGYSTGGGYYLKCELRYTVVVLYSSESVFSVPRVFWLFLFRRLTLSCVSWTHNKQLSISTFSTPSCPTHSSSAEVRCR